MKVKGENEPEHEECNHGRKKEKAMLGSGHL